MINKANKIFEKTGCISSENLYRYFQNKLPDEERRIVEKHLVDCEMCRDELEGIEDFENTGKFKETQTTIDNKILFKYGRLKVKSNIISVITGIAASVLLAIISGYIIFLMMHHFEKKEIAQHIEKDSANRMMTLKREEIAKNTVTAQKIIKKQVTKKVKNPEETPTLKEKEIEKPEEIIENNIQIVSNDEVIEDEEYDISEVTPKNNQEIVKEEPAINTMSIPETKSTFQAATKSTQKGYAISTEAISQSNSKMALGSGRRYNLALMSKLAFEQQDYKNAKRIIETAFSQGIETDSLFYFYSVACFNLELPDSTIVYLKKMKNSNLFQNGVKWFLANSYLAKYETNKAIILLKEIAQSKQDYSLEAKEKLSEISGNE